MDIKGNTRRLLKYLTRYPIDKAINPVKSYDGVTYSSRAELDADIEILSQNNLLGKDGDKIYITPTGVDFINQIEASETSDIYKDIFNDYLLSLMKYFYKRNEALLIEDLPVVFGQNIPSWQKKYTGDDMNLIQFIEIDSKQYFDRKGTHFYELNENGRQYLSHLLTAEEKSATPIFSTLNIQQHIGDNITVEGNKNNVATGNGKIENSFNAKLNDDPETAKEANKISKKTLIWTVIIGLLTLLLTLIAGYKQGWFS